MKLFTTLNIVFLFIVLNGCAQKRTDTSSLHLDRESDLIVRRFIAEMKVGKYQTAISELLTSNENINLEDSSTIYLLNKFNYINEVSGKFIDSRLIRKKTLGSDVGIYSFLTKYEKKYYRFLFVFYNNGSKVRLFEFSFDDSITEELKESVKLYF